MSPSHLHLSVIVPCFGRPRALDGLLDSFARQTLAQDRYEVLLVDDGSSPWLAGLVSSPLRGNMRWIQQPNAGPGAARNNALRQAGGQYVLFLNSDAVLADDTLERHLAHHAAHQMGPPRAVLGCFDWLEAQRDRLVRLLEAGDFVFPYGQVHDDGPLSFEFCWTGNLSVPLASVTAIDGFDEGFRRAIWEDVELGFRLVRSGVEVHFDPSIACGHDHPMTLEAYFRRCWKLGFDWVRFRLKHGQDAPEILGNQLEPTRATADELLSGLLALGRDHRARIDRLVQALEAPGDRDDPELPQELGVATTLETIRGIVCGLSGVPPERIEPTEALRSVAAIVVVQTPEKAAYTGSLHQHLAPVVDVVAVVYEDGWDFPEGVVEVAMQTTAPPQLWRPLLEATAADILVFTDGAQPLSHDTIGRLRDALRAAPAVGIVGIADGPRPAGSPVAHPTPAVGNALIALQRFELEHDRLDVAGDTILDRLLHRGRLLAEVWPEQPDNW